MTGRSRFGVLGPLSFTRDGASVPVPGGHQRSLLALLLGANGARLHRDKLIDELWGDRPPASAVSALHVHLSKVRDLVGELMVRDSSGYALATEGYDLDVHDFDALVDRARLDPARAAILLREALGLVRGDPLSDVACEGSVAKWRQTLQERRLQAVMLRIDADLAAGSAHELVAELEQLVAAHPFDERLWGQLILSHYRCGRPAEAIECFERARRTLALELGLEPSASLVRLHAQILDGDTSLLRADSASASAPLPPSEPPAAQARRPRSNLPGTVTKLVGREPELAVLQSLLGDPDVRAVTLVGPGGVGKTRLVLALARRLQEQYADGALLVRLERVTEPGQVAAEIARALDLRDGSAAPGADGLLRYLRDREMLILIDNFEHLLVAAPVVSEILEQAPGVRVLTTSRAALRIRGERVFVVHPLALPAGGSEQQLADSPAVQLFLQRAAATAPSLALTGAETAAVAAICRALDGLPLAIELAASRCDLLTPAQMLQQLAHPLSIGERALRDLPDRQQTLRATIAWSYDLLSVPAQQTLLAAGVFLGGFTMAALDAVLERPAIGALAELREANLIRPQGHPTRFELLELVRAFAVDAATEAGVIDGLRLRHRRYFASLMHPLRRESLEERPAEEISAPFWSDHANLRAAFDDAVTQDDQAAAVDIVLGLRVLWVAGSLRQESSDLTTRMLGRFTLSGDDELALLNAVSGLDVGHGGWNVRFAQRAAELGDAKASALALVQAYANAINARDHAETARLRPRLEELIAAPETDLSLRGWAHYMLGGDDYVRGRFASAAERAELSVRAARDGANPYLLACGLQNRLLASSALSGRITQPEVAEVAEHARRHGVQSVGVAALWFAARYAAGVDPPSGRRWLALAERGRLELDEGIDEEDSPEEMLRTETMAALGVTDLRPLLAEIPAQDLAEAIDEAVEWLLARDPSEVAPRVVIGLAPTHP